MNELEIIKMPFYEWTLPEDVVEESLNFILNTTYSDTYQNYFSQDRNIGDTKLKNFINDSLLELKEKLYPNMPYLNIKSTQIWGTRTGITQKHHRHFHSNSVFSGIIYLTDHEKSGATRFYFPNIYFHHELNNLLKPLTEVTKSNHFDIFPKKGRMIIFPSNIEHETTPNKDRSYRYTISFNSFFEGTLGNTDAATALGIKLIEPETINTNRTKKLF